MNQMFLKNCVPCISGIPTSDGLSDYAYRIDSSDYYELYKNFDHYSNIEKNICCPVEEPVMGNKIGLVITMAILALFSVTLIITAVYKGWFSVSTNFLWLIFHYYFWYKIAQFHQNIHQICLNLNLTLLENCFI